MLTTELLVEPLWSRLRSEATASRSRLFAVAYVTDHHALHMARGDTLVVDASDEAIASGKTSAVAIEALFGQGIIVFSLPHLHAKVYVFDSCAIVGSPNLSKNSQKTLHEAAIFSSDPSLVSQAAAQVSKFASRGLPVDATFVDRIKGIEVIQSMPADFPEPQTLTNIPEETVVTLYRLAKPPKGGALLRAYFVALIQLQLGHLRAEIPFRLWDGNFKTHLDNQKLLKRGSSFVLSHAGVTFFTTGKGAAKANLLNCFLSALRTGRESDLPDGLKTKTLVQISHL